MQIIVVVECKQCIENVHLHANIMIRKIHFLCNSSNLNLLNAKSTWIIPINILKRMITHHIMPNTIRRLEEMLDDQSNILKAQDLHRTNRRVLTWLEVGCEIAPLAICGEVWLVGGRRDPGDVESILAASR